MELEEIWGFGDGDNLKSTKAHSKMIGFGIEKDDGVNVLRIR